MRVAPVAASINRAVCAKCQWAILQVLSFFLHTCAEMIGVEITGTSSVQTG
jgi:hypothetical protein